LSGVFRNIDPPPPDRPASVWGEDTLAGVERGWGVNSSEDARHCSVLYICKYFVVSALSLSVNETSSHGYSPLYIYTAQRMGQAGWPSNELKA
jgi:hypothetical protein